MSHGVIRGSQLMKWGASNGGDFGVPRSSWLPKRTVAEGFVPSNE